MMIKFIQSRLKAFSLGFVILITFALYSPTLKSEFVNWDDDTHLTNNYLVRSLSPNYIKEIFSSTVLDIYIPLTVLSYAVEYHFFAYNPFVYHLSNVLLHLLVVALVFWFVLELGQTVATAFFSALIFGIHPIHVESVAWITERKDVLYSVFYMLSLCTYVRYLKTDRKVSYYLLSLVFGLLSVLSKPMALSLPLALFACDWFCQRKFCRRALFDKVWYFLFIIPIAWKTYSLHQRAIEFHLWKSLTIWVWTFSFYIQKFFWPVDLRPLYKLPEPVGILEAPYWIALIILCFAVYLVISFKKNKVLIFSLVFYFLSIFFLLRFDSKVDINIVADRFMYLPCLGFCILAGYLIDQIAGKTNRIYRWILLTTITFIFIFLSVQTLLMGSVWKNSLALWNYVISKDQSSALSYNNRGEAHSRLNQYEEALLDYNRAIELDPMHVASYTNRADAYLSKGNSDQAFSDLNKSLSLQLSPATFHNRANLYFKTGKLDLAIKDYTQAISQNPKLKEALNNRGLLYAMINQSHLAIEDFNQAISIDPVYSEAFVNRCYSFLLLEKYGDAISDCTYAIKLNPNLTMAYYNRGIANRMTENYELSLKDFAVVIESQPSNSQVFLNRSFTFSNQKRWTEALADAIKARELGTKNLDSYIADLTRFSQGIGTIQK